jgi:hypothetical protein
VKATHIRVMQEQGRTRRSSRPRTSAAQLVVMLLAA